MPTKCLFCALNARHLEEAVSRTDVLISDDCMQLWGRNRLIIVMS